jgi:hypothetical protein
MTAKDKKDFIEWLGLMYLDFDNAHYHYIDVTTKEIEDKLKEYDSKRNKKVLL